MKILVISDAIATTETVSLNWTYRFMGAQRGQGFRRVGILNHMGFIKQNICGYGDSTSKANCVRFAITPTFSGSVTKLVVKYPRKYVNKTNYIFRWAITSEQDDWKFTGHNAPQSQYLMASGKFNGHNKEIYMEVSGLESGHTYYIYLTPSNGRYGNFHIVGDVTVDVYTATGAKTWKDATPYIWLSNTWKKAFPYTTKNGQWTSV